MPKKLPAIAFSAPKKFSGLKKPLERALFFVFSSLKERKAYCEIYCVRDSEMKLLNRRFKGKNGFATVLSFRADPTFPRPDVPKGSRFLGEIYLAPDYIARKKEWPLPRYAVHGALHLLGYTHSAQSDRIEMELQEAKLASLLEKKKVL